MSSFQELYEADLAAYGSGRIPFWTRCFHYYLRRVQTCSNRFLRGWYHLRFRAVSRQHRMELSHKAVIGKGLCLRAPFTLTVNSGALIGEYVTLGKNVTIGKQNRGEREGVPTIGDRVIIGDNAVIVGKITIGNDAVIAPNAYVNRDVPAGSEVSGSRMDIME